MKTYKDFSYQKNGMLVKGNGMLFVIYRYKPVLFSGYISSCLDLPPWLPGSQPAIILSRYFPDQIIFSRYCSEQIIFSEMPFRPDYTFKILSRPDYILGDATIKCTSL